MAGSCATCMSWMGTSYGPSSFHVMFVRDSLASVVGSSCPPPLRSPYSMCLCPHGSVSMQRKHVSWRPWRLCPGPLWRCLTPYSNLPGCFFLDLSHFSVLERPPFEHKHCLTQHHWVVTWLSMSLFWRWMPVGWASEGVSFVYVFLSDDEWCIEASFPHWGSL